MITAIIGKAGTGKSTIARILSTSYDECIEADAMVKKAYEEQSTLDFFSRHTILYKALQGPSVDKSTLIQLLLDFPSAKLDLEDFLFQNYLLPSILASQLKGKSLLVDGIVPRFATHFEQVITVEADDSIRQSNLRKRGVSEERIRELFDLQQTKS